MLIVDRSSTQQSLIVFLNTRIAFESTSPPYLGIDPPGTVGLRAADSSTVTWFTEAEQLGEALVDDVGFRALELGTWLNSPDGELIAAAVQRVLPPAYRLEYDLVVEALKFAASRQQQEGWRKAVGVGVFAGVGLLLWYWAR